MKVITTEIQINANSEQVWNILTDLDKYPQWNPFIKKAKGRVVKGEKLEILISSPNKKEISFKPTVLTVQTNLEFGWLGHLIFPGLFDGEHTFTITSNEKGCLLIQKEIFRGLLVPLVWNSMEKNTKEGFELMNKALKKRAEDENIYFTV